MWIIDRVESVDIFKASFGTLWWTIYNYVLVWRHMQASEQRYEFGACTYQSRFGRGSLVLVCTGSFPNHTTLPCRTTSFVVVLQLVLAESGFTGTEGLRRRRRRRRKYRHAAGPWHIIYTASRDSLLTPREGTCRLCRPRGDVMASEAGHDTTPVPWPPIVVAYR